MAKDAGNEGGRFRVPERYKATLPGLVHAMRMRELERAGVPLEERLAAAEVSANTPITLAEGRKALRLLRSVRRRRSKIARRVKPRG